MKKLVLAAVLMVVMGLGMTGAEASIIYDFQGVTPVGSNFMYTYVAELSADELWALGVKHLGWPAARPTEVPKDKMQQLLLQAKYRDVGDFGTPEETPPGWISNDE